MTRRDFHHALLGAVLLAGASVGYGTGDGAALPEGRAPAADTAAILAFWATLDATWNDRDAARFSQLFTEDTSFGFIDRGTSMESREAVLSRFTGQFGQQSPNLRHATEILRIHPVTSDLVALDGQVEVTRVAAEGTAPTLLRRFAITGVMVHTSEGWLVRFLRAFELAATPASSPSGSADHR